MAKRKRFNPHVEWFKRMFMRKVVLVRAKLRDESHERYMILCTQCLTKRRKKAEKETHWNRSMRNYWKGRYAHKRRDPPEYYSTYRGKELPNDKCQDCGFTLKGK